MSNKCGHLLAMVAAVVLFWTGTNALSGEPLQESALRVQRRAAAPATTTAPLTSTDMLVTTYINEALVGLRDLMRVGLPEFGIAPLEPVRLDNTTIDSRRTGAQVHADFSNMTMYGISTMQVRKAAVNLQQRRLDLQLAFSNWTVLGTYNMTGKLVKFIPIYGNGSFYMEASDVLVSGSAALNRQLNGSLAATDFKLDLTVDDVKSHFHNLNGGGAASSVANSVLSFLSESIFNNSKPTLIEKLRLTLERSLNRGLRSLNVAAHR